MFLMFGMQYMISGAYAYREDQHVRVDVLYTKFSPRGKAIADIISSVFFFIFTITLLWTGWRFASDAIQVGEHSRSEEHTSELQSLMRISYAVFCLKKQNNPTSSH